MKITENDKTLLLKIARLSIESSVKGEKPKELDIKLPDYFEEDCGAFVTLHKNGQLRGCVGYILPVTSLHLTIVEMAKAAALHDGRFSPVKPDELPDIDIEISVLTPPQTIASPNEFIIGQHGIIINLNGKQAVFLPQVATEQKWDMDTTLQQLCLKAGLSMDAYKDSAMEFKVFEAIVCLSL